MSKGAKQTSEVTLPPHLEQASIQNLMLADEVGRIGYAPNRGPTIAGLAPEQRAAMESNNMAASAFGLPTAASPDSYLMGESFNGGAAYGAGNVYDMMMDRMPDGQRRAIEAFVMNPNTGAAPTNPGPQVNLPRRRKPGKK